MSLFNLSPLKAEVPTLPQLSPSKAQFTLPPLDEHAPGVERLLGSLRDGLLIASARENTFDSPRKDTSRSADGTQDGGLGLDEGASESSGEEGPNDEEGIVQPATEQDIWSQAALAGPSRIEPLTWTPSSSDTPYLSEKPQYFDPLITLSAPPLSLPRLKTPASNPPITSFKLLALMIRATLGTAMNDSLRWSRREGRFVYAEGRVVGMESVTSANLVKGFLDIGTGVRRLEIIIEEHNATPITPTHHALLHSLSTVLTYLKDRLAEGVRNVMEKMQDAEYDPRMAPWLRREMGLRDARELVTAWCEVMCWPLDQKRPVGLPARPSSLLSHLHSHLVAWLTTSSSQSNLVLSLAYILSRSSEPFLNLLHQWLGLAPCPDVDDESQPWLDLGIRRDRIEGRWEYTFTARRMPTFIPRTIRRTLFDAGCSLRALHEATNGTHPLCNDWSLRANWGWGADAQSDVRQHSRRVQREVDKWRGTRPRTMSMSSAGSKWHSRPGSPLPSTPPSEPVDFWATLSQPPGYHLPQVWKPAPLDDLENFIAYHTDEPLLGNHPTLELYISSRLLSPLLTHAQLIAQALISLYLDDLAFLSHLDMLQEYWLGGNAGFVERVGTALFTPDGGTSSLLSRRDRQRAKGKDADEDLGMGLGLGLSDRRHWPPGGGKLAFALRMTLLDEKQPHERGWKVEDLVSFAIHGLPDEDDARRAKWLDPMSVEALDFLYLSYSPPPVISTLLPPSIMEKYQSVHNLLLRLQRAETVLSSLFYDVMKYGDGKSSKEGVDMHSKKSTRLMVPRRNDQSLFDGEADVALRHLRFCMSWFVTAVTRYILDTAIRQNWEVMRRRLDKLRRRAHLNVHTESRPMTPADDDDEFEDLDGEVFDVEGDEEDKTQLGTLSQLQSAHSLVLYHRVIMNRILRACLLSPQPGHQITFKILMSLLSLILDLCKTVKDAERRGDLERGAQQIHAIRLEWSDKLAVFFHALERLSLRTPGHADRASPSDREHRAKTEADAEQDLQLLLEGEVEENSKTPGSAELQELLMRLKLGVPASRAGRWK